MSTTATKTIHSTTANLRAGAAAHTTAAPAEKSLLANNETTEKHTAEIDLLHDKIKKLERDFEKLYVKFNRYKYDQDKKQEVAIKPQDISMFWIFLIPIFFPMFLMGVAKTVRLVADLV